MKILLAACALAGLVATPVRAQDAAPRVFTQSGSWSLDYGDDYCRLAGNFTNGADRIALAIERIEPGPSMRVALVGNGVKLFRRASEIGLTLAPAGTERKLRYVVSTVGDEQYVLFERVTLAETPAPGTPPAPYDRAAEAAQAKGVTALKLASGLTEPVEVRTGPLGGGIKALQGCTDDMVQSWGLDAARHQTLSKPAAPAGPTAGWLVQGTIPFGDFAKLGGGMNQLRVMLDASGKATDCKVHWASLDAAKNQQICAMVLERGTFTPALDAGGQPMASYVILSPFFLLPPPPAGRGR